MPVRWLEHVDNAKHNPRCCRVFMRAIRKYGPDVFDHEVLDIVTTEAGADRAEQVWIEHLGTTDPTRGYNLTTGGHNGRKRTKEALQYHAQAVRAGMAAMSSEAKARMRAAQSAAGKARHAATPPERLAAIRQKKAAALRVANARKTPEERSAGARKAWCTMRADAACMRAHHENGKRLAACMTPVRRSVAAKKAALTSGCGERMRRYVANLSPEELRERAHKMWRTRRTNGDVATKRIEAERFLRELLGDGEMRATEALARARAAGITEVTLGEAKRSLGVVSLKRGWRIGGAWYWTLVVPFPPGVRPKERKVR